MTAGHSSMRKSKPTVMTGLVSSVPVEIYVKWRVTRQLKTKTGQS